MTRCKAELITPGAGLYQEVDELEDESVTYLRAMILKEWGRDLKKGKFAVIWKSNSNLAGSSDPSEVFYESETGKFIQKTQTYRTARIYEIRRDGSLKYLEQRRLRSCRSISFRRPHGHRR